MSRFKKFWPYFLVSWPTLVKKFLIFICWILKNRTKQGIPYYLVLIWNLTKLGTTLIKTVLTGDPLYIFFNKKKVPVCSANSECSLKLGTKWIKRIVVWSLRHKTWLSTNSKSSGKKKKVKKRKSKMGKKKRKIVFWQYVNVFSISKSYLLKHVAQLNFLITDLNDVLFRAKTQKIYCAKPK